MSSVAVEVVASMVTIEPPKEAMVMDVSIGIMGVRAGDDGRAYDRRLGRCHLIRRRRNQTASEDPVWLS